MIGRDITPAASGKRRREFGGTRPPRPGRRALRSGGPVGWAGSPGQGGTSEDLTAKYAAAIQQAVLNQWIRPDTVPLGQRCRVVIRQLPGGEVIDAKVQPGCPFDDAGQRSLEAAVLRAQPLPYRGFESAFNRTLILNFEARDR